jgi:hypothetical protein
VRSSARKESISMDAQYKERLKSPSKRKAEADVEESSSPILGVKPKILFNDRYQL